MHTHNWLRKNAFKVVAKKNAISSLSRLTEMNLGKRERSRYLLGMYCVPGIRLICIYIISFNDHSTALR